MSYLIEMHSNKFIVCSLKYQSFLFTLGAKISSDKLRNRLKIHNHVNFKFKSYYLEAVYMHDGGKNKLPSSSFVIFVLCAHFGLVWVQILSEIALLSSCILQLNKVFFFKYQCIIR